MTMTDDVTRSRLEEIVAWWPILAELQEALYAPGSTGRTNASGVRSTNPDSAPMIAVIRLEQIHTLRLHVELLAHEWGWQPGDGPHHHYLLARWPWAKTHMPTEHTDRITHIHTKLQRLVKEGPLPTNRVCPSCGESQLMETREHQYWCGTCDLIRDESELRALVLFRLTTHEAAMTPRDAAQALAIPEQTIYSWIRRGHLERCDGRVILADAQRLKLASPSASLEEDLKEGA